MSNPRLEWGWEAIAAGIPPGSTAEGVAALFDARRRSRDDRARCDRWPQALLECSSADIAAAYELRTGNDDRRKSEGAFYTPIAVARELIELDWAAPPRRALDPACGCGAFLVALSQSFLDRGLDPASIVPRLHGVDIDPVAVAVCRGRLAEELGVDSELIQVYVGDSLAEAPPQEGPFDLVVGNPPFGNAIESRTARSDRERADFAERFPEAATGAYDRAGLFVEAALRLLSDGGRLAMVLPRALLSAKYATRLRRYVVREFTLSHIRAYRAADHFASAAVYVVGVGIRRGTAQQLVVRDHDGDRVATLPGTDSWAPLISPYAHVLARIPNDWPRLGEHALVQAGAAAGEAYDFRPHLTETPCSDGWKLLTTGSIDPFVALWNTATTRYLKATYDGPWLPRAAASARRASLYDAPKVIVAGLSKVLEAVADLEGEFAGAVATIAVRPKASDVRAIQNLERFLNSWLARTQFLALHGAQALGGGSVQVTKQKLAELRFPPGLLDAGLAAPVTSSKALPETSPASLADQPWELEILELGRLGEWIDSEIGAR